VPQEVLEFMLQDPEGISLEPAVLG
jgi:hypothetical protein